VDVSFTASLLALRRAVHRTRPHIARDHDGGHDHDLSSSRHHVVHLDLDYVRTPESTA
jgi:hypothetical protein